MAKCIFCHADTSLFVNGTPVCIECDNKMSKDQRLPAAKSTEATVGRRNIPETIDGSLTRFAMDLYSTHAVDLRIAMEAAKAEMGDAEIKQRNIVEKINDMDGMTPAQRNARLHAARDYRMAAQRYRRALAAWSDHVLNNPIL